MRPLDPVGLATAQALIDFGASGVASPALAHEQLRGAVAVHNILADQHVAYLADEVGMGKTYVALGAVALMRHFNPGLRVLFIAPRENIQNKWLRESRNFIHNNWKLRDGRVARLQGGSARPISVCRNLRDFLAVASHRPHQDFLLRLTSFSMGLGDDFATTDTWPRHLRRALPSLPPDYFEGLGKQRYKDHVAHAINAALPTFDLVVIDEGHNLKHGFTRHAAARNRVLGLALGHPNAAASLEAALPLLANTGCKAHRVLLLSATPLETDYRELWNQLDVCGKGAAHSLLRQPDVPDPDKQAHVRRILVRRLTSLDLAGVPHTKNMYRREWRAGGVELPDVALSPASAEQRLVVALMQKKVTDLLAARGRKSGTRFKRSFQMGLLASFESFLQTAKSRTAQSRTAQPQTAQPRRDTTTTEDADDTGADSSAFDSAAEQTTDVEEQEGIDAVTVENLATSFRESFGRAMPHPKMDACADQLGAAMLRGDKSLVFVRRVASVPELVAKLSEHYDRWVIDYLRARLPSLPRRQFDSIVARYEEEARQRDNSDFHGRTPDTNSDDDETRARDSFFSWFFRGAETINGMLSGGALRKNRLKSHGGHLATFFDDDHVGWVLGLPKVTRAGLQAALPPGTDLTVDLRDTAYNVFRSRSTAQRAQRALLYRAYQEAALLLLCEAPDVGLAHRARVVLDLQFLMLGPPRSKPAPPEFPDADILFDTDTLFTELQARPAMQARLWPTPTDPDPRHAFRERAVRRELLTSAISLGHSYIDLWLCTVRNLGTLALSSRDQPTASRDLARAYLDLLESQSPHDLFTSRGELQSIADHHGLLMDVNFSDIRDARLPELARRLQQTLGHQQPVAGMSGGINHRVIRQFRMPGYPIVLVTTDVLQEGEDLHTFAATVLHYGISWTPSAMEQRTGRIDRIGSLAHRRLTADADVQPSETDYLQVLYPYLAETVEVVQVREIFRRMNRFVRLLHEGLAASPGENGELQLHEALLSAPPDIAPIEGLLTSPFEVDEELLHLDAPAAPAVTQGDIEETLALFRTHIDQLSRTFSIDWDTETDVGFAMGTAWLRDHQLVAAGADRSGARRQPFSIRLRGAHTSALTLMRFTSPVGRVGLSDDSTMRGLIAHQTRMRTVRLCAWESDPTASYDLAVDAELMLHPEETQFEETTDALARACLAADALERDLLDRDESLVVFAADLTREHRGG